MREPYTSNFQNSGHPDSRQIDVCRPDSTETKNSDGDRRRINKVGHLQCFNLYVGNLPLNWSRGKIREKFSQLGGVLQVFVPGKLNKAGKRFGFVRMDLESDIAKIIEALHESFFDKNKIVVRQAESFIFNSKSPVLKKRVQKLRFVPTSAFQHSDVRSYKDVTKGTTLPIFPSILLKPIPENDEWLSRSLVGWLSKPCSPSAAVEELKSLIDINVEMRYMGGNMLLHEC